MNPFTRLLLGRWGSQPFSEFVERWDALERLVIRVFKGKAATVEDEAQYAGLRRWLQKNYARWQPALDAYWRRARINGELVAEDPFAYLFSAGQAADFVRNWRAMQTLPAAREAINSYLVDQIEK